jgi:hypothetical protein
VDAATRLSVEEVRRAIRSRGGTLACPICGRDEFELEGAAILDDHRQYGSRRLRRAQLVCENCAFVLSFGADRLHAAVKGASTAEEP